MGKKDPDQEAQDPLGAVRFEDAVDQIERVIDQIESGEAGLEESLKAYEQASKLIVRCRSILGTAEKRIAQLTADSEGRLRVADDGAASDAP